MATMQHQVVLHGKFPATPMASRRFGDEIGRNGMSFVKGTWKSRTTKEQRNLWLLANFEYLGVRQPSGRPWRSISASLGFTADPRVGIERAANGLLKDAAMLLLYQDVFRSPPAQAFLKILLGLRRGDDGLKLLESYGEFFKLMAIGRYPSWEDYILEGILSGEKNPFAEAAANVGNPRGVWSGGVPPSLRAAAAADLDSLQRLSITESTLSGWVAEIVTDVRPEWRTAAASNFSSKSVLKSPAASDEGNNRFGFNISGGQYIQGIYYPGVPVYSELNYEPVSLFVKDSKVEELGSARDNAEHPTINISASEESESINSGAPGCPVKSICTFIHEGIGSIVMADREMWRKKIGGLWRWSEAVPLLEKYYTEHSVGRVASTQFLQWKGGKITIDSKWVTNSVSAFNLSIHKAKKEALLKNLTRHVQRCTAHHVLLFGPSGSGKSWLLKSVLGEVTSTKDLHIITVPTADVKSIYLVLEELARHWQLRFALVIHDLLSRGGEETYGFLKSALDGNVQDWPDNVILCATSSRKVAIQGKDGAAGYGNLADLFGLAIEFDDLGEGDYHLCVQELVENRKSNTTFATTLSSEDLATQAETWADKLDLWSVRSAAQFVNLLE